MVGEEAEGSSTGQLLFRSRTSRRQPGPGWVNSRVVRSGLVGLEGEKPGQGGTARESEGARLRVDPRSVSPVPASYAPTLVSPRHATGFARTLEAAIAPGAA